MATSITTMRTVSITVIVIVIIIIIIIFYYSFLRFPLFPLGYFLKETENIFFMFLSSYRNTCEGLGELKKAVETLACCLCSHSISCSPKPPHVFP